MAKSRPKDIPADLWTFTHAHRNGDSEIFAFRGFWEFDVDEAYRLIQARTIRAELREYPVSRYRAWNEQSVIDGRVAHLTTDILSQPGLVILFDQGALSSDPERYRSRPFDLLIDGHHRLERLALDEAALFRAWHIANPDDIRKFTKINI